MEAELKQLVREHWEKEVCGSRHADTLLEQDPQAYFAEIDADRYRREHMLPAFARWGDTAGKKVLEVGLGTGADFMGWVRAGAIAYGRDLTQASVAMVRRRLALEGRSADVALGDAESLDFPDNFFDIYYAWGALHHSPDTERALAEAYRVLKPGGELRIMIYHFPSVMGWLVWAATGPLRLRWLGPRRALFENLESPGTKAYSRREAYALVRRAFPHQAIKIRTWLGPGDLLSLGRFSPKYASRAWRLAIALYPAWLVKHLLGDRWGGALTIEVVK